MATPDTSKVVIGLAYVFTAPADTAPPADTVLLGGSWGGSWVYTGGTEEGFTLNVGSDTGETRIEEQSTPVLIRKTSSNVRVTGALAEDTVETMKLAYGGGDITTTAAGVAQPAKKRLALSETLGVVAVGFEAVNSYGFWRRGYIPRAISVADVATAYRRATDNRKYNIELRAICRPDEIHVDEMSAVATG